MLRYEPMTPAEHARFLASMIPDYAAGHVRAGQWSPEEAPARALAEVGRLLPKGIATPDHSFRTVVDAGTGVRVGELWTQLQRDGPKPRLFIYWIGIDPAHRRRGHAAEVLRDLEGEARAAGADRIALHVFGENEGARTLYRKLGFVETNVLMAKPIDR